MSGLSLIGAIMWQSRWTEAIRCNISFFSDSFMGCQKYPLRLTELSLWWWFEILDQQLTLVPKLGRRCLVIHTLPTLLHATTNSSRSTSIYLQWHLNLLLLLAKPLFPPPLRLPRKVQRQLRRRGQAPPDGEKKKRRKVRKETYSSYIYKG